MPDYTSIPLEPATPGMPELPNEFEQTTKSRGVFWASFWHDAGHDFKTTRWGRFGLWFTFFIWTGGLLTALIIFNILSIYYFTISNGACLPDGSFSLYPWKYSAWSGSGFFQITLGFGQFSFTEAKVIDIFWDIILGRICQAFMAFFAWRAFTSYVTTTMETVPVTYETFWTVFILKGPQGMSILRMIREFYLHRGLPSKTAMGFMILSMTFILAFPTLASAMTGYQQNSKAFVSDSSGNYVPFSFFSPAYYVIHDGQRVNLTNDYYVMKEKKEKYDPVLGGYDDCYPISDVECWLISNVSEYVSNYGDDGERNEDSVFMNQKLPPPVLNISATAMISSGAEENQMIWVTSNQTYNYTWIVTNGSCQPLGTYQWGFSFFQLFLMIVFQLIWTFGTYIMWLKAHLTMQERGRVDVAGEFKAAVQLATAMHNELQEDPLTLTERHLRHRIKKELNGGKIAYESPFSQNRYSVRRGLGKWFKREKWWFSATFASCVIFSTIWMAGDLIAFIWTAFLFAGMLVAMLIGTTNKSRIFIAFCGCLVGTLVVVPIRFTAFGSY